MATRTTPGATASTIKPYELPYASPRNKQRTNCPFPVVQRLSRNHPPLTLVLEVPAEYVSEQQQSSCVVHTFSCIAGPSIVPICMRQPTIPALHIAAAGTINSTLPHPSAVPSDSKGTYLVYRANGILPNRHYGGTTAVCEPRVTYGAGGELLAKEHNSHLLHTYQVLYTRASRYSSVIPQTHDAAYYTHSIDNQNQMRCVNIVNIGAICGFRVYRGF